MNASDRERQRAERLARITRLAEEVWDDCDLAREFVTSAQPQLGGRKPIELMGTDLEARQVERLLLRLEWSLSV